MNVLQKSISDQFCHRFVARGLPGDLLAHRITLELYGLDDPALRVKFRPILAILENFKKF